MALWESELGGNGIVDSVKFNTGQTPAYTEGLLYYDEATQGLVFFNANPGVAMNIGSELWVYVRNNGAPITNGQVCYLSGISAGLPTVGLAKADSAATCLATMGFATVDIPTGGTGFITRSGTVRNIDTSAIIGGGLVYLSAETAGAMTATIPDSPSYVIVLGNVGFVSADFGTVEANVDIGGNTQDVIKIFNGSVLEDTVTTITADGAFVDLEYSRNGGGDLSLFFNGGFFVFDADPPATARLTAGSDESPTQNFVYIPESTMDLTVSTAGFPTEQHVPVATVVCQSAASVVTDGVYKLHAWTDHLSGGSDQGHLAHVNHWIRNQPATWQSGVAPTTTVTANPAAIDNVDFATTAGEVLQLHDHAFPAINTALGGPVYVVNDPIAAYDKIADLADIDLDSTGATLRSNNTYYSLIIWGVVSEDEADCKLFCNTPSGSYTNADDAGVDPLRYSDFTIPTEYKGTGFLIARVVLRYQTLSSGTFTEIDTEVLLGLSPSSAGGGGGGVGSTEFSDNTFRIFNVTDSSKQIQFALLALSTATTRTVTMPDSDVDLGDIATNNAHRATVTGNPHAVLASQISDFTSGVQAISINALSEDPSPTLGADLDGGGNYLVNTQNFSDMLAGKGPGYWFDGVSGNISLTATGMNPKTGDYSIVALIKNIGGDGAPNFIFYSYEGGVGDVSLAINSNGYLQGSLGDSATSVSVIANKTDIGADGKWHTVAFTIDRDSATGLKLFIDGDEETYSVQDSPISIGDVDPVGTKYIGIYRDGSSYPFVGGIAKVAIKNLALTPEEVQAYSNGAPIPWKYHDASQEQRILNGDFVTDTVWTKEPGITITGGQLVFTSALNLYNAAQETNIKAGKATLVTYTISGYSSGGCAIDCGGTYGTTRTANGTYTEVVLWGDVDTSLRIRAMGTSTTLNVDNISVVHAGCVLDLNELGIGHNTWVDVSGNQSHGDVDGPIPFNRPSSHTEKYIDTDVTGDTSFTLPAGYIIDSIILDSDGAIGGGIDVGTTNGGGEIVTAQPVTGAGKVLCALVTGANYNLTGADDMIYITDADGTGWDGATVSITVQMARLEV